MPRVQRNNVVLTVREDEVQHYIRLGYNLTTPTGQIIQAAVPTDLASLQKAYVEQTAKVEELENTIVRLTAALNEAKKAAETKKTRTKKSE